MVNVTSMGYEICGVRFDDWEFQAGVLWFVGLRLRRLRGKGREGKGRKGKEKGDERTNGP